MAPVLRRVRTLARQPLARQLIVAEAVMNLLLARGRILQRGQHGAIQTFTRRESASATPFTPAHDAAARDVQWAISALARWLPERNRCLISALAASRMLSRRGLAWTMTVGITKDGRSLRAHAWLRCGTRTITGKHGAQRVTPLVTYQS